MVTKVKSDYLITLSEAKAHLRVDTTDEDGYIMNAIKAAVNFTESYIQQDIATTANTLVLDDCSGSVIEVDDGNMVSVTSVTDSNATVYTVSKITRYQSYFQIELSTSIPGLETTIVYNTGYTASTLPPALKQAILIKLADFYDIDRNSQGFAGVNASVATKAFESLCNYYVIYRVKYIRN